MLAETLHSKKTVPVEPAKLVDEENVQPASLHIDRAEVSTSPPLSERSKARGSFAKDAKSYAPVRRPADHGSKEAKDLPPSYDFKN